MKDPHRLARFAAALSLALSAAACLELEERIDVHPNGAIEVTVRAKGDVADLLDGHPLPRPGAGAWQAADAATARWIAERGPAPGQDYAERGESKQAELAVRASFASAAELPRYYAPPGEPYADAHLARDTSLVIQQRGACTVYLFERVYRARTYAHWSFVEQFERGLPDELRARLDRHQEGELPPPSDVVLIAHHGAQALADAAEALARDALSGIYTRGDAALPLAGLGRVVASVRRAILPVLDEARVARAFAGDPSEFPRIEAETRERLRAALAGGLAAEGVPEPTANAVLEQLEWNLTALDQTTDLGDEELRLSLRLPGTVVAGNHERVEGDRIEWTVKGEDLRDRDVVLRAVAVLE